MGVRTAVASRGDLRENLGTGSNSAGFQFLLSHFWKCQSGGPYVILWQGCCRTLTLGRRQTGVLSLSTLKTLYFLFSGCPMTIELPISQADIKWLLI